MIPINTLLGAYRRGLFPMAVGGQIGWYSPERRGILPLGRFHVSTRLHRVLRKGAFHCTVDRAFRTVIAACAERPNDAGNWIDGEIIESYCALHDAGFAHSVEVWQGELLVGGLYGVTLRGAFFGESMFYAVTHASKVALGTLVDRLRDRGYQLLDVQWLTPHLARLGAIEVPRHEYLVMLAASMEIDCEF